MGKGKFAATIMIMGLSLTAGAQIPPEEAVDSLDVVSIMEPVAPEGFEYKDSVIYVQTPLYNELLAGKDIFEIMSPMVNIEQSEGLAGAVAAKIKENAENLQESDGYRIRIYFDNRQNAREASEYAQTRFETLFPGYNTYRSYSYPNFKVTVGDFRTKTEAQIALQSIAVKFPSAFIVREKMKFPVISQTQLYTLDTIKVLVPVAEPAVVE